MKAQPRGEQSKEKEGGPPIGNVGRIMKEEEHSTVSSKLPYILISLKKMYFQASFFRMNDLFVKQIISNLVCF